MPCEACGASTRGEADLCRDCAAPTPKYVEAVCVLALVADPFVLTVLVALAEIPPPVAEWSALLLAPLFVARFPVYYGLFRGRAWGWGFGVPLFGAGALMGLVALAFGSLGGLVALAVNGAVAAYIYSEHEAYLTDSEAPS